MGIGRLNLLANMRASNLGFVVDLGQGNHPRRDQKSLRYIAAPPFDWQETWEDNDKQRCLWQKRVGVSAQKGFSSPTTSSLSPPIMNGTGMIYFLLRHSHGGVGA